jgi:hypothetical protein
MKNELKTYLQSKKLKTNEIEYILLNVIFHDGCLYAFYRFNKRDKFIRLFDEVDGLLQLRINHIGILKQFAEMNGLRFHLVNTKLTELYVMD